MPRGESYRDVHVNRPLTNFSIALWQDPSTYVAPRFFSSMPVNNASDTFTVYPKGYFNRVFDSKRDEEGVANSIQYKTKEDNYSVDDKALRIFISDKKRANADAQRNLDLEGTTVVTNALMLGEEKDFSDKFLATGKWTTDVEGAASPSGAQILSWKDDSADPVQNVLDQNLAMIELSGGRKPNKGLMTIDVYYTVREHPSVLDRVKYGNSNEKPSQVSLAALAQLFELDEIMIMQSVMNIAADGVEDPTTGEAPATYQFLASGKFLLAHVAPSAGLLTATSAQNFIWNQYISLGLNSGPAVRRYRPQDGKKGEYIEGELAIDRKIVAADLGCLMHSLLAV